MKDVSFVVRAIDQATSTFYRLSSAIAKVQQQANAANVATAKSGKQTKGVFEDVLKANLATGAIYQGFNLAQQGVAAFSAKLMQAKDLQTANITAASTFASISGQSYSQGTEFIERLNQNLAKSAAALPGATQDYKNLAIAIQDNVLPAFQSAKGLDMGGFESSVSKIAESYGALSAGNKIDTGNTALGITQALGGASIAQLRQYQFFEQNQALKGFLEKRLIEMSSVNQKGAASFEGLDVKQRVALLQEGGQKFITEDFKREQGRSIEGLIQSSLSNLFDPTGGIFGFMRDLDTAKGNQSVIKALNESLDALVGPEGLFGSIGRALERMGLQFADPMASLRNTILAFNQGVYTIIDAFECLKPDNIAKPLMGMFDPIMQGLVNLANKGINFAVNIFSPEKLIPIVWRLGQVILSAVGSAIRALGQLSWIDLIRAGIGITAVVAAAIFLGNVATTAASTALMGLGPKVAAFTSIGAKTGAALGGFVRAGAIMGAAAVSGVIPAVMTALGTALISVGPMIAAAVGPALQIGGMIFAAIGGWPVVIGVAMVAGLAYLAYRFRDPIMNALKGAWAATSSAWNSFSNTVVTSVSGAWNSFTTNVGGAMSQAWSTITGTWNSFKSAVIGVALSQHPVMKFIRGLFIGIPLAIGRSVATWFIDLGIAIRDWAVGAGATIARNFSGFVGAAGAMISAGMATFKLSVVQPLAQLWQAISMRVRMGWQMVTGYVSAQVSTALGWLNTTIWQPIWQFMQRVGLRMGQIFRSVGLAVAGTVLGVLGWLRTTIWQPVVGAVQAIGRGIGNVLRSIAGMIGGLMTGLRNRVWNPLVTGVSTMMSAIGEGIRKLWEAVKTKISNTLGPFVSWVQGFDPVSPQQTQTAAMPAPAPDPNAQQGPPAPPSRFAGFMPAGILRAAALESRRMPAGASLAMANSSEAILRPDQLQRLMTGSAQAGAAQAQGQTVIHFNPTFNIAGAANAEMLAQQTLNLLNAKLNRHLSSQLT